MHAVGTPHWHPDTAAGTPHFADDPRRACHDHDVDDFFPEPRDLAICTDCIFRAQCLIWALEHNATHGVYGGVRQQERIQLRKRLIRRRNQARLRRHTGAP
jgi:transcription factor WhiB